MHLNVTEARKIMGRLTKGDDLLGALTKICQDLGITLRGGKGHRGGEPGPDRLLPSRYPAVRMA